MGSFATTVRQWALKFCEKERKENVKTGGEKNLGIKKDIILILKRRYSWVGIWKEFDVALLISLSLSFYMYVSFSDESFIIERFVVLTLFRSNLWFKSTWRNENKERCSFLYIFYVLELWFLIIFLFVYIRLHDLETWHSVNYTAVCVCVC